MCSHLGTLVFLISALCLAVSAARAEPARLDLSHARVVTPPRLTESESRAVLMLVEEVERRTQIRWQRGDIQRTDTRPIILVGEEAALDHFSRAQDEELTLSPREPGADGYRIEAYTSQS